MNEVILSLNETISKLSDSCHRLMSIYQLNYYEYFIVYKEKLNFDEFFNSWKESNQIVNETSKKLEEKGKELNQIPFEQWEIMKKCPYDTPTLENNHSLALPYVICNEAQEFSDAKDVYGYYCNRIVDEFKGFCTEGQKELIDHFSGVSKMFSDIFKHVRIFLSFRLNSC